MRNRLSSWMVMGAMVIMLAWAGQSLFATALTASRDTPQRDGIDTSLTMASNVIIYAGAIVCVDTSGLANPGADTASYAVVGQAEETVDNRTAVYVSTKKIAVARGVFRWENADSIEAADIGKIVYVTDDATVNKTGGGNNIIAGTVVDVDSSGVWVDTGKVGPIGAATPSSLSVSGAATVGTTLSVSGNSTLGGTTVTVTNNLAVTKNETVGGTLGVTGDVTGAGKIAAYSTYPVMLGDTNGTASGAVFLTQVGTVASTGNDATLTATNTFGVSFIATPTVMWRYSTAGIPATNATTVASNAFTVAVCQTNGTYIAVGRIK